MLLAEDENGGPTARPVPRGRTARFYLGPSRPLIAMNCYFDGSVGGVSDKRFTLGGLIATDATWAAFQAD